MIESFKFFSNDQCDKILDKLDRIDDFFSFAGWPFYIHKEVYTDNEKKYKYNNIFKKVFKDEMDLLVNRFEEYLGENVYTHPELGLPGFHKMIGRPGLKSLVNFHFDDFKQFQKGLYPELGVLNSTQYNFTIQLTDNGINSSGLCYFEDKLSKKLNILRAQKTEVAHLDPSLIKKSIYQRGSVNIHKDLMHSIFFENNSSEEQVRITLQGVLMKTSKGYLIFW
jgi:hypothetical protein